MNDNALQNRTTEIIKPLVPPDAEERVNRSFKQWNHVVRDHIRTDAKLGADREMALNPRRGQKRQAHS